MNTAKQIDHINMVVPDVKSSLEWYINNLGFKLIGEFSKEGFDIYYIDNGSVVYELFEDSSLTAPRFDHIAYISEDVDADYEFYQSKGLECSPKRHIDFIWERGADYFFVTGPAGEKIELIKRR